VEPEERHSGGGEGTEGSGPAALGLQQQADGRGGTGAGVGPAELLQPGREHERLEQSSQSQPAAHLLPHGTTLDSRAQFYVRVYNTVKEGQRGSYKPDCSRIITFYVSSNRLHQHLTPYYQSSYKVPSIFSWSLTFYVNSGKSLVVSTLHLLSV